MANKKFVPCYRVTFLFFDLSGKVFRTERFEVDYFLKDRHGVSMYDLIQDNWCIPYKLTSIDFERIEL